MVAGAASAFLRPTPLPITGVADRRAAFSPGISIPSPRSPAPPCATATAASTWYTPIDASPRLAPATPAPTLYDVLGLAGGATSEEIKSAYRRLARSCHPDARRSLSAGGASAEDFMRLHAAYSTLSDPDTRADYDRRMVMLRRSSSFSPKTVSVNGGRGGRGGEAAAGLRRRSWESDQCW